MQTTWWNRSVPCWAVKRSSWPFVIYFRAGHDLHAFYLLTCLEPHSNWATNSPATTNKQGHSAPVPVVLSAFPILAPLWLASKLNLCFLPVLQNSLHETQASTDLEFQMVQLWDRYTCEWLKSHEYIIEVFALPLSIMSFLSDSFFPQPGRPLCCSIRRFSNQCLISQW